MPTSTIISIGNELLRGDTLDTNARFLAQELNAIGISCVQHLTVPDTSRGVASAIKTALKHSDIIITTGGLGSTHDDPIRAALKKITKKPFVRNTAIKKAIEKRFKKYGAALPVCTLEQAHVPRGATVFMNTIGSAPGIMIRHQKRSIVCLPGPPRELQPMARNQLVPCLKKKYRLKTHTQPLVTIFKLIGLAESAVYEKISDLIIEDDTRAWGIYADSGEVHIHITDRSSNKKIARAYARQVEKHMEQCFCNAFYGINNDSLEHRVGQLLQSQNKTIAVAESCTGGRIASQLTAVPGSSACFMEGIVTYDNASKIKRLGVSPAFIKKYGAVSEQVAVKMAEGVRKELKTSVGLSTTGIAGPTGGTKKKPVGLVYIACSIGTKTVCKKHLLSGDREYIQNRATQAALDMVRRFLLTTRDDGRSLTNVR